MSSKIRLNNLELTRPLVFFDLEATGTNPQADRIVEIALVKLHPDGKSEVKSRRFNPTVPIPAEASEIHGIHDADVADEPTFASVASSIYLYLEDCDLAGYNIIRYDVPLLRNEFKRADLDFRVEERKLVDAQTIFHQKEPRTLAAAMRFFCGKELEGAHEAKADVLATLEVLDAQLERYRDLPRDVDKLHGFCNPRHPRWIDATGKFKWGDDGAPLVGFGKNQGVPLATIAQENRGFLAWMLRGDFPEDAKNIAQDALAGKFPQKRKGAK